MITTTALIVAAVKRTNVTLQLVEHNSTLDINAELYLN